MKVLGRGLPDFVDVPDQPSGPANPIGRADSADHSAAAVSSVDPIIPVVVVPGGAASSVLISSSGAGAQFVAFVSPFIPVASAVSDVQTMSTGHADLAGLGGTGDGSGAAGGGDGFVSLAMNSPDYSDHGWFVVPSAANEYGASYAAADGFVWDIASGEFASDWFFA